MNHKNPRQIKRINMIPPIPGKSRESPESDKSVPNQEYHQNALNILDAILKENPWDRYALWEKYLVLEEKNVPNTGKIQKKLSRISSAQGYTNEYPYKTYAGLGTHPKGLDY